MTRKLKYDKNIKITDYLVSWHYSITKETKNRLKLSNWSFCTFNFICSIVKRGRVLDVSNLRVMTCHGHFVELFGKRSIWQVMLAAWQTQDMIHRIYNLSVLFGRFASISCGISGKPVGCLICLINIYIAYYVQRHDATLHIMQLLPIASGIDIIQKPSFYHTVYFKVFVYPWIRKLINTW